MKILVPGAIELLEEVTAECPYTSLIKAAPLPQMDYLARLDSR